jgi:hypothetical protein
MKAGIQNRDRVHADRSAGMLDDIADRIEGQTSKAGALP